jgi:hypothetical protein
VWAALDQAAGGKKAQRKLRLLTAGSLKLRLVTAQREGEVQMMKWNDLDLDTAWWTIPVDFVVRTEDEIRSRFEDESEY